MVRSVVRTRTNRTFATNAYDFYVKTHEEPQACGTASAPPGERDPRVGVVTDIRPRIPESGGSRAQQGRPLYPAAQSRLAGGKAKDAI